MRGFTLLELIVVIVIIGILASVAVPQYMVATERARAAEGVTILGALRESEMRYYAEWGAYTATEGNLDVVIDTPKYFTFAAGTAANCLGTTTRNNFQRGYCGGYVLRIHPLGTITCTGGANNCCGKMGW